MKNNSTGKKQFSRSRLVKELSWSCELPQTKISTILDTLAELARREARNTFILPGICKLEVVRRKPRKMRNPRTGESFMLPERDALRITAPRSLKLACAKVIAPAPAVPAAEEKKSAAPAPAESAAETETPITPPPVAAPAWSTAPTSAEPVAAESKPAEPAAEAESPTDTAAAEVEKPAEPVAEESAAEAEAPAEATSEEPATPPSPLDPSVLISFRCTRCHQEVEATGDMVGMETECPTCGNPIMVPAESEPGTIHSPDGSTEEGDGPVRHAQTVSSREAESLSPEKLKGLTIRINVGDLGLDTPQEPVPEAEPPADQMITFVCDACKQEIEASRDLIGEEMLCPGCGAPITVPAESTASAPQEGAEEVDPKVAQAMKARTMRIDMGDDF